MLISSRLVHQLVCPVAICPGALLPNENQTGPGQPTCPLLRLSPLTQISMVSRSFQWKIHMMPYPQSIDGINHHHHHHLERLRPSVHCQSFQFNWNLNHPPPSSSCQEELGFKTLQKPFKFPKKKQKISPGQAGS